MTARTTQRLVIAVAAVWLAAASSAIGSSGQRQAAPSGVRGLWVGRAALMSSDTIAAMVRDAEATGVNTLFVQVRGRGEAYYRSRVEPRAFVLAAQAESFDPLAETIARARAAGIRVHAWVNVNLVSSAVNLPGDPEHVVQRHPEWLMVPRALAPTLTKRSPRSSTYLGALAAWTAGASSRVEGLFTSPLVPAAQDHAVAVVRELVRDYPLDGLHLDYIRYPGPDFDYNRIGLDEFRRRIVARGVSAADRRRLDGAVGQDPTAWTRAYAAAWARFREERLTALVARLQSAAREARPGIVLSAAVAPHPDIARAEKFQLWPEWAEAGYVDALCPMIYTADAAEFQQLARLARERIPAETALWAGIGAYRLSPARTAENVRTARGAGAEGVILFSYENLTSDSAAPISDVRARLRAVLLEASPVQSP